MTDEKVVSGELQKKKFSGQVDESGPDGPRLPPDIPNIPIDDIPLLPEDNTDINIPLPIDDIGLVDSSTQGSSNLYDIVRLRANSPNKYYSALEDTNYSRGDVLKKACTEAESGDILQLNMGIFEINYEHSDETKNTDLVFPLGVKIRGMGAGYTTLFAVKDGDGRCLEKNDDNECVRYKYTVGMPFQLTNSILEDLTIECKPDSINPHNHKTEDAKTIGYFWHSDYTDSRNRFIWDKIPEYRKVREGSAIKLRQFKSSIIRCEIISNAWAFYSWNNCGDKVDIIDSKIVSGHQGVSIMGSGSYQSTSSKDNEVNIYRSTININVNNSFVETKSAVNNDKYGGVYGVVSRGGKIKVVDCDFYLIGEKERNSNPVCVAISDSFNTPGAKYTEIHLFNNRFYIIPNRSKISSAIYKKGHETVIDSHNSYVQGVKLTFDD